VEKPEISSNMHPRLCYLERFHMSIMSWSHRFCCTMFRNTRFCDLKISRYQCAKNARKHMLAGAGRIHNALRLPRRQGQRVHMRPNVLLSPGHSQHRPVDSVHEMWAGVSTRTAQQRLEIRTKFDQKSYMCMKIEQRPAL